MPETHSTSEIARKLIAGASRVANDALEQCTTAFAPNPEKDPPNASEIARRLHQVREMMKLAYATCIGLLTEIRELKRVEKEKPAMQPSKLDTQHAIDLLTGRFPTGIEAGTRAETLLVQIANNHGKFQMQMITMLQEVERIETRTTPPQPASAVKVVSKPAGKAEKPGTRPAKAPRAVFASQKDTPAAPLELGEIGPEGRESDALPSLHETPDDPIQPPVEGPAGNEEIDWTAVTEEA